MIPDHTGGCYYPMAPNDAPGVVWARSRRLQLSALSVVYYID